jgi:PIN domain nuclease of toxin-antitoxin system
MAVVFDDEFPRARLALLREALPVVTADRSWARLDLPVKIVLIR